MLTPILRVRVTITTEVGKGRQMKNWEEDIDVAATVDPDGASAHYTMEDCKHAVKMRAKAVMLDQVKEHMTETDLGIGGTIIVPKISVEMTVQVVLRKDQVYWRFGKKYKKISRNEIIKEGAMHSFCDGELFPVINSDTIGDIPSNFSDERDFYNPVED